MRIIAGSLKGAQFDSPHSRRTHPMSDRVRGALFNALGDIDGLRVFDPFGGSGALSFEAISRGAASVVVCEIDKQARKVITTNIERLSLTNIELYYGNARSWLRRHQEARFDIVLADPPYDDIDRLLLQSLIDGVAQNGIFVLSWPGKEKVLEFTGCTKLQTNGFGDAQLVFFRKD